MVEPAVLLAAKMEFAILANHSVQSARAHNLEEAWHKMDFRKALEIPAYPVSRSLAFGEICLHKRLYLQPPGEFDSHVLGLVVGHPEYHVTH